MKPHWIEKLVNSSHIGILLTDEKQNNLFANDYLCELFGHNKETLLATNAEIFHVNHSSFLNFADLVLNSLLDETNLEIDYQVKHSDGTLFWINISANPMPQNNEILWTIIDITQKIQTQDKLKDTQKELADSNYNLKKYLDAIDKIGIGLFVVNEDYTIRSMNKTMTNWFGDQQGKSCYASVVNFDGPCSYCKLHEVIHENKKVMYEPSSPDGQFFHIIATSIKNSDGTSSKMELIRDVTEQKLAEQKINDQNKKLSYQAHHDSLTGLPNRTLFNDRLSQSLEKAKRNNSKIALLFLDLDHFKKINDSLGHDVGDEVLKYITSRLKKSLRDEDTIARLGGDEFAIILEDVKNAQDASLVANDIINSLSKPIHINTHNLYVSSSIGISIYPDDGNSVTNLLKFADSAMYKAKDEGRNNYQYYNAQLTELAFERVFMETSLREAIKNEEFVVYYQPQVDGKTHTLIGMEALVRWNHAKMGLISPAKFIPLAESTGLIVEIDRLVMRNAMTQLSKWHKDGLNPGILAMNLAVKQLQSPDFFEMFKLLIKETECKPEWIELEVTEGQIMTRPDESIIMLQKIRDIGIEIAVDDFGTGYSSLAYLTKLPINKLKIDQAFIRDLPQDKDDATITKAVIALSKSLNLKVIAEGVETQEQKDFIIQNGCENIQGYYYSKPVTADKFEEILIKGCSKKIS
jgi:diguanylate cyclase (GGDEF)-like protein/PAS domain S-box-containing protein